jgi:hypothetical protein
LDHLCEVPLIDSLCDAEFSLGRYSACRLVVLAVLAGELSEDVLPSVATSMYEAELRLSEHIIRLRECA